MSLLTPWQRPAWIEDANGNKLPYEPAVQLTGTAVTSVTDDPTNERTVVQLTAGGGGGGGGGLGTSKLTELQGQAFNNAGTDSSEQSGSYYAFTDADVELDQIGITVTDTGIQLPVGLFEWGLTISSAATAPSITNNTANPAMWQRSSVNFGDSIAKLTVPTAAAILAAGASLNPAGPSSDIGIPVMQVGGIAGLNYDDVGPELNVTVTVLQSAWDLTNGIGLQLEAAGEFTAQLLIVQLI